MGRNKAPRMRKKKFQNQNRQATKVVDLPEDIIRNILSRLPVKSLVRFQSVSKCWFNYMQDPYFQLNSSRPCSLMVFPLCLDKFEHNHLTLLEKEKQGYKISGKIPIHENLFELGSYSTVAASCNGLVCLTDNGATILVYNPITQESIRLPETNFCDRCTDICLAFDGTTKKYKIVKMDFRGSCSGLCYKDYRECDMDCEIITLGDTKWKKLNIPNEFRFVNRWFWWSHSFQFFDGAVHWLVTVNESGHQRILALDVDKEKFRFVKCPEFIEKNGMITFLNCDEAEQKMVWHNLGSLGTSMALFRDIIGYERSIWKLLDSKEGSWSPPYKFDMQCFGNNKLELIDMLGEHILLTKISGQARPNYTRIIIQKERWKQLTSRFIYGDWGDFKVIPFVPTFASLTFRSFAMNAMVMINFAS